MKKCLMAIFLILCGRNIIAQERMDSVSGLSNEEIRVLTMPLETSNPATSTSGVAPMLASDLAVDPVLELKTPPTGNMHFNLWPKGSQLPHWATGFIYGYSGQSSSLLYGYTANAGMGVNQQLGRYWTMNGGLSLNKYSIYNNIATLDGSLTWQPNRYFGTTVFGNYSDNFLSLVAWGPSWQWDGFVTLQTDTDLPFGVDAGVRNGYDPLSGHWTTPIIKPFVNIGGSKLGIDLGPLIQNALQRARKDEHSSNGFTPIPKPVNALPQVAPRR